MSASPSSSPSQGTKMPPIKPATTTRNSNSISDKGRIEKHMEKERELQQQQQHGSVGVGSNIPSSTSTTSGGRKRAEGQGGGGGVCNTIAPPPTTSSPSASGSGKGMSTGCVRWCVNVALQSFAGEPWAVNLGPVGADATVNTSFSHTPGGNGSVTPNSSHAAATANGGDAAGERGEEGGRDNGNSPGTSTTTTTTTILPRIQTTTAASRAEKDMNHSSNRGAVGSSGGASHHSGADTDAATPPAAAGGGAAAAGGGSGSAAETDPTRGETSHSVGGGSSATHAVFGSKYGTETTAAQRCGVQMYVVDWDQEEVAAAVSALEGGGGGNGTGSPTQFYGPQSEELQLLEQCVTEVNDPPVTYGNDELLHKVTNVEFLPTVVERTDPESGFVDSQMHYHLRNSLEPLLNATVKPAVTATVDHCISSIVLVYGATQEMKQMGLIGTPEECGLLPHAIRLFMERHAERKEEQLLLQQQQKKHSSRAKQATAAGAGNASEEQDTHVSNGGDHPGSPESRPTSGNANGTQFVFPPIGSKKHTFTRIEATFIAFDSSSVIDLINLENRHVELVLQLAPPPTPSAFEDASSEDIPRSSSTPTTDSYVLHASAMPAETTNDALSALDVGLENLSRALEKASLQSESGSSLLFSLTAYTDNCRCATMHVLCLAEDPAAQTWLASTVLARSQAIPLGEEQSWASIQNTPMPPPLHHHAATLLVPALCFGNIFASILICVYNSMSALSRLSRDLTLAVTGYRMRTIPRVTPASSRTGGKVPLPAGWEEHFTEDGRRYYTDTSTLATTWEDPRFVARPLTGSGGIVNGGSAGGAGGGVVGAAGGLDSDGGGCRSEASTPGIGGGGSGGGATVHRPSRISLGDGDRDFLANMLHQPDSVALSGAGNSLISTSGAGNSSALPLDIGIVVVDASCRPRVVLSSTHANFAHQLAEEEKTLDAEQKRMAAATAAREARAREREQRRLRREEEEKERQRQRDLNRQQHSPSAATVAVTTASSNKGKAATALSTPPTEPTSAASGSVGNDVCGTTTTTTNHVTAAITPRTTEHDCVTATASTTVTSTDGASSQHHPHDNNGAGVGSDNGLRDAHAHPVGRREGDCFAGSALTQEEMEAQARDALASTSFDSTDDEGSMDDDSSEDSGSNTGVGTEFCGGAGGGDVRGGQPASAGGGCGVAPANAAAADVDDSDEDGDSEPLYLCRGATSTCEDFEFHEAVSAPTDPVTKSLNTAKFYSNAMQEQVVMVGPEVRGGGAGAGGKAGGASGGASSTSSASVSPSVVGTPAGPGAPAVPDAAGIPPITLPPEMQDLESLVEEFSKFFKRAYESEQRVRELEVELEDLRMINTSRPDLFSASTSSPTIQASVTGFGMGSSGAGGGAAVGGAGGVPASSSYGSSFGVGASSPNYNANKASSSHGGGDGLTSPPVLMVSQHGATAHHGGYRDETGANALSVDAKCKLLKRIEDSLKNYGTATLRERLYPSFSRVTRLEKPSRGRKGCAPARRVPQQHSCPNSLGSAAGATTPAVDSAPLLTPRRTFRRGTNLADFFLEVWETTLKQYHDVEGQLREMHKTRYTHRVSQLGEDTRALTKRWAAAYEQEVARLRDENAKLKAQAREERPDHGNCRSEAAVDGEANTAPLPSLASLLEEHHRIFQAALQDSDDLDDEEDEEDSL